MHSQNNKKLGYIGGYLNMLKQSTQRIYQWVIMFWLLMYYEIDCLSNDKTTKDNSNQTV